MQGKETAIAEKINRLKIGAETAVGIVGWWRLYFLMTLQGRLKDESHSRGWKKPRQNQA